MNVRAKNVLLITSDQQRGDCYGFEGRNVKTPHLDLMAAAGTRFSACITPNNVCQPSRASILTGLFDPPPLNWSTVYAMERRIEDGNETTQTGRDCREAAAG
jgi:hypothetical protein